MGPTGRCAVSAPKAADPARSRSHSGPLRLPGREGLDPGRTHRPLRSLAAACWMFPPPLLRQTPLALLEKRERPGLYISSSRSLPSPLFSSETEPGKKRTKISSSKHPRKRAGLFWVKHIEFSGKTRRECVGPTYPPPDPKLAQTQFRQKGNIWS